MDESLYAHALAEEIVKPGREAGSAFRAVSRHVYQATQQRQRPDIRDLRFDDFVFNPRSSQQVAVGITEERPAGGTGTCDGFEVSLGTGGTKCVKPGSGQSFKDCPDCPEMVVVPAGTFNMGSPITEKGRTVDERLSQHSISKPLAIGKFEITFDNWNACVTGGGCNSYNPPDNGWGQGKRPAINVRALRTITESFSVAVRRCDSAFRDSGFGRTGVCRLDDRRGRHFLSLGHGRQQAR